MTESSLWERVKGHDETVALLRGIIDKDRLGHAYLFYGPRGVGKATTARVFAAALNCSGACGVCRSCLSTQNRTHPDLQYIEPEGAQDILLDQITRMLKTLNLKKYPGNRKVVLIDDAHKLRVEAANALLKALEEPPDGVTFILVVPDTAQVLSTITSRCQRVAFGSINAAVVRDILVGDLGVAKDKAELAVGLTGGKVGEALEMSTSGALKKRAEIFRALIPGGADIGRLADLAADMIALAKARTKKLKKQQEAELAEMLQFAAGSSQGAVKKSLKARYRRESSRVERKCYRQVLVLITSLYRDMLLISQDVDERFLANTDLAQEMKRYKIAASQIRTVLAHIEEASRRLDRNVSPLLAFENLFFALEAVA